MKVGDLVKATGGDIAGMLGLVTGISRTPHTSTADVLWADGSPQTYIATKYLEVIQKNS